MVPIDAVELVSDSIIVTFEKVAFIGTTYLFLYRIVNKAEVND